MARARGVHGGLVEPPKRSLKERLREVGELIIEEEGRKLNRPRHSSYEMGRSQGKKDAARILLLELEEE